MKEMQSEPESFDESDLWNLKQSNKRLNAVRARFNAATISWKEFIVMPFIDAIYWFGENNESDSYDSKRI